MPQTVPGEPACVPISRTSTALSSHSLTDTFVDARSLLGPHDGRLGGRTALIALKAEEPRAADDRASPNEQLIGWAVRTYNLAAGDTIVLVNVRSEIASPKCKAYSTHVATYASLYDAEEREKSLQLLHAYQGSLRRRGFGCRILALAGDKREQIAAAAARERADCIVVGQPRRHMSLIRTKRPLASDLARLAAIPVTAVPLHR